MARNFRNILDGLRIFPKASSTVSAQGDLDVDTTSTKVNYHNGTSSSPVVTETHASQGSNRLKNKDLEDSTVLFVDNADPTKKIAFQLSGITTGNTRTITVPDSDITLVGSSNPQTISNKIIDNTNTITVKDNNFTLQDDGDVTKQAQFQLSGITTGNTRTFTLPDATDTVAVLAATQTLTNKTLTGNTAVNLISGAGTFVFPTSGTVTTPNGTDTLVARISTDTGANRLQNKELSVDNVRFVDPSDTTKKLVFNISALSTSTAVTLRMPTITSNLAYVFPAASTDETLIGTSEPQTIRNKNFEDANTIVQNTSDSTKRFKFSAASISTSTLRTITIPDADFTMVGTTTTQTLTNKTLTTPETDVILMDEQGSTPSNPAASKLKFYAKNDDQLYFLNSSGVETVIASNVSQFDYFASTQVTTLSTAISSNFFTHFDNSPAFTFSPTFTGIYKIYSSVPITNSSTGNAHGEVRIFKTSGVGTLLQESVGGTISSNASAQVSGNLFCQSTFSLTASTSYVFDIQGRISADSMTNRGDLAPFYLFAERVG